jgi:predicted O-methyltransferase YrrM
MEYRTFFSRFGGSARTKHILPVAHEAEQPKRSGDKRPFLLPPSSELPKEFIRLCPWEMEYLFAVARRARRGILETGRFNGGSLFVMACAAAQGVPLYSIDIKPRNDEFLRQQLAQHCPDTEVHLIVGDSQKGDHAEIKDFDLLFIDGDHTYEGCLNDIRNWYDRLLPHGHLMFHDSYLGQHGVQDAILDFLEEHPELDIVQSPIIGATHWHYPAGSLAHLIKSRTEHL